MYSRGGRFRGLGDVDDPFSDDFAADLGDSSSDPRGAYVAWAAAVKRYGGVVTAAPSSSESITAGTAAARYPVETISLAANGGQLNPIFKTWPDLWTDSSRYGYYRAPASVLEYTNANPRSFWDVSTWLFGGPPPITTPQTVPGEPTPPRPTWYNDLLDALKAGGWIVGGLVALSALSFLPRRRD